MRVERVTWDGEDAAAEAGELRDRVKASPPDLVDDVAAIIADVEARGDTALRELTARFDATDAMPDSLVVPAGEIEAALSACDTELRRALELAAVNIRAVAEAELDSGPATVRLAQGQEISIGERAVGSAGAYAPGGRAPYPSSVLMTCIPAKVAGVERVALATPPAADGRVDPVVLAAAAIAGADEVISCGGAQAIAALAVGTETIDRVDVIAGPGNAWVTEAKRQLFGRVGVDGLAGPSELVVVCDRQADPREIALDAMAQAEHGPDSPVFVLSADAEALEEVGAEVERLAPALATVADAPLVLVACPGVQRAVQLSDCLAPEHLELRIADAGAALAMERTAGCVFVGAAGATAFGDYAAGSNHVLPTAGAARFSGPLGVRAFLRQSAVVTIPAEAAAALAPAVDRIARAEGFPVHGESATARAQRPESGDLQVD